MPWVVSQTGYVLGPWYLYMQHIITLISLIFLVCLISSFDFWLLYQSAEYYSRNSLHMSQPTFHTLSETVQAFRYFCLIIQVWPASVKVVDIVMLATCLGILTSYLIVLRG